MRSFAAILLTFSLPLCAFASHLGNHPRHHSDMALRAPHGQALEKRGDGYRFTYYDISTGEVACGGRYSPSDHVVALNTAQFGSSYPSPQCGKQIVITINGKSTTAVIRDACPGCPYGGLDFTQGLFEFFASTGAGVLYGSWDFAGAKPDPTTKTPDYTPPVEKPTSQYHPPSTTHQHTTSTTPPPPSSSSSSPTSSSSISKTHSSSSPNPSSSSQPLSTPTPSSPPTSSEPNYNNIPANDIAQSVGSIVPDAQGGLGALFSLYEAIIDFGVISDVCKS